MTKLIPLYDRVVVKRAEADARTPGGLFIPAVGQEKPQEAMVVAVGPGKITDSGRRVEPSVKVGDRVLLTKWTGSDVKAAEEDYVIEQV